MNTIEEAIEDLKQGKCIIVVDDEDRENEGDLVALAEKVTPETINFLITYGKGLVCVAITEERAKELELTLMVTENTDPNQTAFTISIDSVDTSTGISAYERAKTIRDIADPTKRAKDFRKPGHIFPLIAKRRGVLQREGHTEAAVDLAKLCGAYPAAVICEIINTDGTMARLPDLRKVAQRHSLKLITIEALKQYRWKNESVVQRVVETKLPTEYGTFNVIGYQDSIYNCQHVVLIQGKIQDNKPILTRLHSECLTGDVFRSLKCDCGRQLDEALRFIQNEGQGIVIYLRQEGRGIGLLNKLKAYHIQEQGYDTVDANKKLGFPPDMRDYKIAADILKDLGVREINILTNNPDKIEQLEYYGITICRRVPLEVQPTKENFQYLKAKKERMGHLLQLIN